MGRGPPKWHVNCRRSAKKLTSPNPKPPKNTDAQKTLGIVKLWGRTTHKDITKRKKEMFQNDFLFCQGGKIETEELQVKTFEKEANLHLQFIELPER